MCWIEPADSRGDPASLGALDSALLAFEGSPAMIAAMDDDPARRFLASALGWHVLWAALLLPYAIVIALILGGQAAAQDLVDNLASVFFQPVLVAVVALPLNVALAAVSGWLLARTQAAIHLAASAFIFAIAWLVGIQLLLPATDLAGNAMLNPIAVWAALAGAAYGLVVALLDDRATTA
jgi:hypothetical protein